MIAFKFLSKLFVASIFFSLTFSTTVYSQNQKNISEELIVQNYPEAPLEIKILSTFNKPTESDKWVETCFYYSVENKTKRTFDTYSYEIIDKSGQTYISGLTDAPKPFQILYPENAECVSNNINEDEGFFTFRLIFVERKGKTIWESEDHKKDVEKLFEVFKKDGN